MVFIIEHLFLVLRLSLVLEIVWMVKQKASNPALHPSAPVTLKGEKLFHQCGHDIYSSMYIMPLHIL